MWNEIHKCFSPNVRKISDYNLAYNFVMKLKEVAIANIRAKVDQTYNTRDFIGNFVIRLFKKMVSDAQKGNNEQMERIEKSYLWYTGGVELMYHWAACGLMGLNYHQAASEVCSMVMGIDYKNLSDMQTMFGNNINMEYKPLMAYFDNKMGDNRELKLNFSKACEYCGKESNNYIYGIVVIPTIRFNLSHHDIVKNDTINQVIELIDGSKVDYSYQVDENLAYSFQDAQPHVFCSDTCIFEYSNQYNIKYEPNLDLAIENFQENNLFLPLVLNPNNLEWVHSSKCFYCNHDFPNATKEYKITNILKHTKLKSNINDPVPSKPEYSVAHSDMSKKNPNGNWYFYEIDFNNMQSRHFCSNDCAFLYSDKHNSYILFKNNFEGIHLGVITEHLKEINAGLKNNYLLRPIRTQIPLDDTNENLKSKAKTHFENIPINETIRFLNGRIEQVECKFDGIWMKPVSEALIDGEIMLAFMPDFKIQFPTLKNGIPSIYKKTIEFAHKLSQSTYYELDNYIYPAFDVLIKEKRTDESRLTDTMKNQIFQLVSFIMNQYSILRNFQLNSHKNDLTFKHLLVSIVNLLYKKDSNFQRENLYYNSQFYLHPIENIFIDQIINKAEADFKSLKENDQGVYLPHGLRDEEELILAYIDAIVFREFFLNHFKSQNETMHYFNFVPDLVEDFYYDIIKAKNENFNPINNDDEVLF